MHTNYPMLVTIPEHFDGKNDNNIANAGLTALCTFLVKAVEAQGYRATMSLGGVGQHIILVIHHPTLSAPG